MSLSDLLGRGAESLLTPFADLAGLLAGDATRWGWAVVLACLAVRLPLWPLLLRTTRTRTACLMEESSTGPSRAAMTWHSCVTGLVQVAVLLGLAIWAWTPGTSAHLHGFHGVRLLSDTAWPAGLWGVAIAVAVVASTVTAAVLQLHIAGVTDERRRFFAAYMLPVILGGVTLFAAPVAILLGWLTTVLVNIAVLLVVRREVSRVAA